MKVVLLTPTFWLSDFMLILLILLMLLTFWLFYFVATPPLTSVSYLISSKHLLFENITHFGSFSIFVFVFVIVFVSKIIFWKDNSYSNYCALSQFLNPFPSPYIEAKMLCGYKWDWWIGWKSMWSLPLWTQLCGANFDLKKVPPKKILRKTDKTF